MKTDCDTDRNTVNMSQRRYPFNITWPTDDDIPLIAFSPIPAPLMKYVQQFYGPYPDKVIAKVSEALKTVEECGCSTVIAGGTLEQMDAIVRATRIPAAGIDLKLNVMLNPVYLHESPRTTLRILTHYGATKNMNYGKYTPFPNQDRIVAWQVMDQPHFWDWGDTLALDGRPGSDYVWNRLTLGYGMATPLDHYYKEAENPEDASAKRLSWFDLAAVPDKKPSSSQALTDWLGSCGTYAEYLDVLDRLFTPKVWCYNFFPFMNALDPDGNITGLSVRLAEFYRYLTLFRDRVNSPRDPAIQPRFWNYTMVSEQKYVDSSGKTLWHRPAPTVGMIRFLVFNSLAFGAKGTAYYMYGTQYTNVTSGENSVFGEAPLSCEIAGTGVDATVTLRKTAIWDSIKTVNSEVESWKSIFINTKTLECFTKGRSVEGLEPLPDGYECLISLQPTGKGVIVSHLVKTSGNPASGILHHLVLVNLDYEKKQEVRASFRNGSGAGFVVSQAPAQGHSMEIRTTPGISVPYSKASLAPGGIAVISWIKTQ